MMRPALTRTGGLLAVMAMSTLLASSTLAATYTPVWFDGYDSPAGNDINAGVGSPRQGGAPVPLEYVTNVGSGFADQTTDYHQQIIGPDGNGNSLLQLAGDAAILPGGPNRQAFHAYASPDYSFDSVLPNGEVEGKKVSVVIDAYSNVGVVPDGDPNDPADGYFTQAAITVGSSETLADSNNKLSGFSVIFIEQTFVDGLDKAFIQIRDDRTTLSDPAPMPDGTVGNLIPNPAGTGPAFVELLIDDATDGNPWDGVGQTDIEVLVNGASVFSYSKLEGGFVDNYITLEGSNQKNAGFDGLGVHVFDGLTVFSAPAVPEPAALSLILPVAAAMATRRRGGGAV